MRGDITKRSVDAHAINWLWDTRCPGFGLRATATKKVYWLRYPTGKRGRSRWKKIGEHGKPWREHRELTAEIARREAERLRGMVVGGGDPSLERDAARSMPTFNEFAVEYLATKAKRRKKGTIDKDRWLLYGAPEKKDGKKPRPKRANRWLGLLKRIGSRRIDQFSTRDMDELHVSMKDTPVQANRCVRLISHMFTMAIRWRILPHTHENPCLQVEQFPEAERERRLTFDELVKAGAALRKAEETDDAGPVTLAAIRTIMFTGARPGEIAALRHDEINPMLSQIVKEDWKTKGKTRVKTRRVIQLNEWARALLDDQPRIAKNPYVFPGHRHGSHISVSGLDGVWERVRKVAELEDVRLSDLGRHNVASIALDEGFNLDAIAGLLGHTQVQTTRRYAHLGDGVRQRIADVVGERVAHAIDAKKKAG